MVGRCVDLRVPYSESSNHHHKPWFGFHNKPNGQSVHEWDEVRRRGLMDRGIRVHFGVSSHVLCSWEDVWTCGSRIAKTLTTTTNLGLGSITNPTANQCMNGTISARVFCSKEPFRFILASRGMFCGGKMCGLAVPV